MVEVVNIMDVGMDEEHRNNERILIDAFPKLCPNMIAQLVRSGGMDLVQMVTHLSGLDVKAQRQTITEEARGLTQTADNAGTAKQERSSEVKKYTTEFNVEEFVALFPNPEETFNNPDRRHHVTDFRTLNYVENYFLNKYRSIYNSYVVSLLENRTAGGLECNGLLKTDEKLASAMVSGISIMKSRRRLKPMVEQPGEDISLLQELAYLEHRTEIQEYIQKKKLEEDQRKQYAIDNGLTFTCQCCFTEDLMLDEAYSCKNDCAFFCAQCLQKSCEIKLGEDKIQFPCLADCGSQFAWTTLQAALPPTLYSKLSQRCTEDEVRAADIKIDSCPFCNFTNTIDDERYTLFQCLNPDCMKESCRLCKEPNHLPLRCDEIEKDEEVKARVHVENKMTDALLRTCWRCNRKFIKDEDGCNKITCVCGAMSCYVCNKPVGSYKHFNGQGGDQHHLCPLYSDMNAMHQQEVAKAAEEAKNEVNPRKLKVDPTADLDKYFEDKRRRAPPLPQLHGMERAAQRPAQRHAQRPAQRQAWRPAQRQHWRVPRAARIPLPPRLRRPDPALPQRPDPALPQRPDAALPQRPDAALPQGPDPAWPQGPDAAWPQGADPAIRLMLDELLRAPILHQMPAAVQRPLELLRRQLRDQQ